ncbi:hypothetical protein B0H14DRAFT_2446127 [Mycena olivaceomarginata]|nr:hypothetical protein B0H14DRAFT_2468267 [Mycena olivaceomarginata]KAJ7847643.1 hypothetical protein B0H14DRAFT_2446127 [Mycena olivaceomarginata]
MTVRFASYRIGFYVAVFLLSGTVLGLAAHFANIFLPHLHPDFTIFALLIPALTIFVFLLSLQFAQPRTEAVSLFILWTLWLAMAAWATDIIGSTQCDALTSETMPTKNGEIRQKEYCYEMKVIQAFSWMLFVLFSFALTILIALVNQAQRFGRPHIWREPIQELGWFHEMPGYYNNPPARHGAVSRGHVPAAAIWVSDACRVPDPPGPGWADGYSNRLVQTVQNLTK